MYVRKIRKVMIMEQTEKKVGRFGEFGGQYIPETLMNEIKQLEKNYEFYKNDNNHNKN